METLFAQIAFTLLLIILILCFGVSVEGNCIRCGKVWDEEPLWRYVIHFYRCTFWMKRDKRWLK